MAPEGDRSRIEQWQQLIPELKAVVSEQESLMSRIKVLNIDAGVALREKRWSDTSSIAKKLEAVQKAERDLKQRQDKAAAQLYLSFF